METNNIAIQSIYRTFREPWKGDSKIVLGIDIGTTYSGVAYSYLVEGGEKFLHRVDKWPGQEAEQYSGKIPTLVWYNSSGEVIFQVTHMAPRGSATYLLVKFIQAILFGAEASSPRIKAKAEDNGWQLAKHFKLHLHPADLRTEHNLELDPLPDGVNLSRIYADFLRYLLEHTRKSFETTIIDGPQVWETHSPGMQIVIAHPNGWGIREQAFLRTSVVVAGFVLAENAWDQVHFVTEAEASVHFCTYYTNLGNSLHPYTIFAVCDAGGSTVDTTVYSVETPRSRSDSKLELSEKCASACVQAGSIFVDKLAEEYLRQYFESSDLSSEEVDEYVTTGSHNFEHKEKKRFGGAATDIFLEVAGYKCKKPEIGIRHGELKLQRLLLNKSTSSTVQSFFDPFIDKITNSVCSQISYFPVSYVILVGGFGSNPYLSKRLNTRLDYTGCQVISPTESTSKAVADGAVIWHCVNSVIKRAPRLSYGIKSTRRYDPHNPEHIGRETYEWPSGTRVSGRWSRIVAQGVPVECDAWSRKGYYREYRRPDPDLGNMSVKLYGSAYGEISGWMVDKAGNPNPGFQVVCNITGDLSAMENALQIHKNSDGTEYWTLDYDVCIRFGRTELEACLEWKEKALLECSRPLFTPKTKGYLAGSVAYLNIHTRSKRLHHVTPTGAPSLYLVKYETPFAWQEALIAIATLFQKFDFKPHDESYTLQLKQTLTLKPKDFTFHAIPRRGAPSFSVAAASSQATNGPTPGKEVVGSKSKGIPMYVFYGSNTGSCEGFAQNIASEATGKGFRATIGTLNSTVGNIPKDGPVVIVTASFEGEPADNAGHFVEVLVNSTGEKDLEGVSFAVFGAGNHDWVHTYQRIPRLVDETLEKKGAKRLLERGEGDAGGDRFTESFDEWETKLWETLSKEYSVAAKEGSSAPSVEVKLVGAPTDRAATLRQPDSRLGLVVENRLLTASGAPAKRHLEFELPQDMTYQAGDYLAILPSNPPEYVRRVLARFKISPEQGIELNVIGPTTLPTGKPVSISEILSGFVEIGQVATKRNISTLLENAKDPATRTDLETLLVAYGVKDGQPTTGSMLDLLEKYPDIDLPLGTFIASLPAMRLRQYSISSSPLWNPSHVTLTIGVVAQGQFLGVASNYLANLRKGDRVQMAVRPSSKAFHPPADPNVPMMLFAAGSGMAPFRGFIQERAMQKKAGREVAKTVLFFGCRKPEEDFLYSDAELAEWKELGVIDVRPAFSRAPEHSEGQKYVQDRVWTDRKLVREYYDKDAKFYTCGGNQVATGIRDACVRIIAEGKDEDDKRIQEIWNKIQSERYATDVFG
ncbi:unnamed protein product [Rhizoctonia solani]|uniref:NADPH-ferrihemoprotein reductase n=1 Tax=Rhizoctonia solani TaxID=456999 RepID=A0A8H3BNF8_9AGAM|nr:unnamed protein product [Rhizoctonia solani]